MAMRGWARMAGGARPSSVVARVNARHPWSHNDHFHGWVLANLPPARGSALDVGCGRGELLAALSPHFATVRGVDVDEEMRQQARSRCAGLPNVAVHGGRWTELPGKLDLVTMVALLHHLDVAEALAEVRRMLAPGGRFLAVGPAPPVGPVDHAWDLASALTNPVIGYVKSPWVPSDAPSEPPFPTREPTQPFAQLRRLVMREMPGASMHHQLGFRHTIAWTKPPG